MALKGKPIAIGTTDTTIYTCPASTEASVHGLVFANNTGTAATITVKIYIQSLGTTTTVATGITVAANSTYTWPKPIDVNASDYIQAAASTGSAIVCLYSVYEGSAPAVAVGFTPRGDWSSAATYAINDVVAYNGSSYLAYLASSNQQPDTATTYWMVLAAKGATGTGDVTGPVSSVDSELALYSSTSGKIIKRASLTGIVKATSGVASAATAGTDYLAPPSGTAILKANSGGALSNATAGTDYVAPGGALGTPSSGILTNCTFPTLNQNTTGTAAGLSATLAVASGGTGVTTSTGSGSNVLSTSPTLVTPILGTPTSGTLTNCTGLPVAGGGTGLTSGTSGGVLYYSATGTLASSAALAASSLVIGGGAGVAPSTTTTGTGILTFLGTPSSANLASAVTDETGSGSLVFGTSPTITNPTITNYVETYYNIGTVTSTVTIDLSNGTFQNLTMTSATNLAVTMPTATAGKSFILIVRQPASGTANSVTWSTVKWPSGTTPTVTATVAKADIFSFICDGTNWYGSVVQNFTY